VLFRSPPLSPQQTKPFNFSAPVPGREQENIAFKLYLDGVLYGSYPIKEGSKSLGSLESKTSQSDQTPDSKNEKSNKKEVTTESKHSDLDDDTKATNKVEITKPNDKHSADNEPSVSAEEKTMKDLEF
jgi:hypothetical protein